MRTREEQIIQAAQDLISSRKPLKSNEYYLVECIVDEAEQRVRAEIGRDSERLDWLEKSIPEYGIGRAYGEFYVDKGCMYVASEETLRDAIDAAREVG